MAGHDGPTTGDYSGQSGIAADELASTVLEVCRARQGAAKRKGAVFDRYLNEIGASMPDENLNRGSEDHDRRITTMTEIAGEATPASYDPPDGLSASELNTIGQALNTHVAALARRGGEAEKLLRGNADRLNLDETTLDQAVARERTLVASAYQVLVRFVPMPLPLSFFEHVYDQTLAGTRGA